MQKRFDNDLLIEHLSRLSPRQVLLFGILTALRMIPYYEKFKKEHNSGSVNRLFNAVEACWRILNGESVSTAEIQSMITECLDQAPDGDDFGTLDASLAADACFAVCNLLQYNSSGNIKDIAQVAVNGTDAVDLYVQEIENMDPSDPAREDRIVVHPCMQCELQRQNSDLDEVGKLTSLDSNELRKIRDSWKSRMRSSLESVPG